MRLSKRSVQGMSTALLCPAVGTWLLAGILSPLIGVPASAQETLRNEPRSSSCDQLPANHHRCEPHGFYIPSLQTLLMIPLSQAGDRLEAAWSKPRYVDRYLAQCDSHCDPRIHPNTDAAYLPPSYSLEDRDAIDTHASSVRASQQGSQDEMLAAQWNAPVKVAAVQASPSVNAKVIPKPEPEHLVQLASGTQAANGVRLTGLSQARSAAPEELRRNGDIKDKYLRRKRSAQ